uniref:Uncharacterized protein n=1 Tax=Oryza barthii TaxID=65489 RepID=A0A0D3H746_9ORYZ
MPTSTMTATPGRLPRPQGSSSAVPRPRGLPGVSVLLRPDKAMDAGEDMPPVAEEPTLRRSDKGDNSPIGNTCINVLESIYKIWNMTIFSLKEKLIDVKRSRIVPRYDVYICLKFDPGCYSEFSKIMSLLYCAQNETLH